jgi:hypothetical protein
LKMIVVGVDIDGTLRDADVDQNQAPVANEDIRTLIIIMSKFSNVLVHAWSGAGELYARQVIASLGLDSYVDSYSGKTEHVNKTTGIVKQDPDGFKVDIAIDDLANTKLGHFNLIYGKGIVEQKEIGDDD